MRALIVVACMVAALNACDPGDNQKTPPPAVVDLTQVGAWEIGPIIDGKNSSIGLPEHPTALEDGWGFVMTPDAEPHYVTARYGTLQGKSRIRMVYRLEIGDDSHVYPRCCMNEQGMVTLYFQKAGDDWNTDGGRWWATFASQPVTPGVHEIVAPLNDNWTSVIKKTAQTAPADFAAAKLKADRIGFTFGGGSSQDSGYGHGVRSTGPGVFTVLSFAVE
jgi:hypothetical protein